MTPITSLNDVTEELTGRMFMALTMRGVYDILVDEGIGPKRMVFALISGEGDKRDEMMVAMEGSGCIFLNADTDVNHMKFIIDGFQMRAAQIASLIVNRIAQARGSMNRRIAERYPQLADQSKRSE
jgi:hypothetical protein